MFTREQIEEIAKSLQSLGTKDSSFPVTNKVTGDEDIIILKDRLNYRAKFSSFYEYLSNNLIKELEDAIAQDFQKILDSIEKVAPDVVEQVNTYFVQTIMPQIKDGFTDVISHIQDSQASLEESLGTIQNYLESTIDSKIQEVLDSLQFQEVLTAISQHDSDIKEILSDLENKVVSLINSSTERLSSEIAGVSAKVDNVSSQVEGVSEQVTGVSNQVTVLTNNLEAARKEVVEDIQNLSNQLDAARTELLTKIDTVYNSLKSQIDSSTSSINTNIDTTRSQIVSAITSAQEAIISNDNSNTESIIQRVSTAETNITAAVTNAYNNLLSRLNRVEETLAQDLAEAQTSIESSIVDTQQSLGDAIAEVQNVLTELITSSSTSIEEDIAHSQAELENKIQFTQDWLEQWWNTMVTLKVTCPMENAEILLNGNAIPQITVPIGSNVNVQVSAEGYYRFNEVVNVWRDTTIDVILENRNPLNEAIIEVHPTPQNATVYIDNEEKWRTVVVPGSVVNIRVEAEDYVSYNENITVNSDTVLNIVLDPVQVPFTVNASPEGCTIRINGVEAPTGTAQVDKNSTVTWEVSKEGYVTQSGQTLADQDINSIDVTLQLRQVSIIIAPVPSDSSVIINEVARNTITVAYGTEISYTVSHTGYVSQTGTHTATEDTTIDVVLVRNYVILPDAQLYFATAGETKKVAVQSNTNWIFR